MSDKPADRSAWAVLLAKWVEFARAAVAIPDDTEDADAWRASVPHVITLQAHTMALAETPDLHPDDRALAADRAAIAIRDAARALSGAWNRRPMPPALLELLADARAALDAVSQLALHLIVTEDAHVATDPDALAAALVARGFAGDLLAPPAGTILARHTPALLIRPEPRTTQEGLDLLAIPGLTPETKPAPPRQVYRVVESASDIPTDTVLTFLDTLPAGRPLLEPVMTGGSPRKAPDPDGAAKLAAALNGGATPRNPPKLIPPAEDD